MRRISRRFGIVLLSIWLILEGLISLLSISFTGINAVMGILALAAGVLLLFE